MQVVCFNKQIKRSRVTSQNGSERYIRKTRHARDLNQDSKNLLFLGQFLDIISILSKPTLQL